VSLGAMVAVALLFNSPARPAHGVAFDSTDAELSSGDSAQPAPSPAPAPQSLDFDLLGEEGKQKADPQALELQEKMKQRRYLLTAHQATGFALSGLMIGTMITGQLNYSDRFGGPNTGRYGTVHSVFALSTEAVFAVTGALAILAPVPIHEPKDAAWSRADVHRFGMLGATAGMIAEGALGFWTASREGYADQSSIASVHLAIGYTTLAFMIVAVGALIL